jgi:hypothetical protein
MNYDVLEMPTYCLDSKTRIDVTTIDAVKLLKRVQ